jgi:hypothetical protein
MHSIFSIPKKIFHYALEMSALKIKNEFRVTLSLNQ